jgi:hypothetical protein
MIEDGELSVVEEKDSGGVRPDAGVVGRASLEQQEDWSDKTRSEHRLSNCEGVTPRLAKDWLRWRVTGS